MRSGAVTPANVGTPDPVVEKQHVLQLLRQGQLNAAFQQVGYAMPGEYSDHGIHC